MYNSEVNWSINTTIERSNNNLKCRKISQIVLLVTGITMIGYGAVRGEAAVVLGSSHRAEQGNKIMSGVCGNWIRKQT